MYNVYMYTYMYKYVCIHTNIYKHVLYMLKIREREEESETLMQLIRRSRVSSLLTDHSDDIPRNTKHQIILLYILFPMLFLGINQPPANDKNDDTEEK